MAFDLGSMLADVSKLDTSREQIEYIPLSQIDADEKNFYALTGIEDLASNIDLIGLQQPIRVRRSGERYIVVSGHRRRAAVTMLAQDNPERWAEVPCIVEHDSESPALQQLKLIYANNATRVLSLPELSEQIEQVRMCLYQLQQEGMEFPGRMRDHVAEACHVSKTKLARLDVIRKGLDKCWADDFKAGTLKEDPAYKLARLSHYLQIDIHSILKGHPGAVTSNVIDAAKDMDNKISDNGKKCGERTCLNRAKMMKARVTKAMADYAYSCPGCCLTCRDRFDCSSSCKMVADEKKRHKEIIAEKEASRKAAEEKAKKDAAQPKIEYIEKCYGRIREAVEKAGIALSEFLEDVYMYHYNSSMADKISGTNPATQFDRLPYHLGIECEKAQKLCLAADLLGVSTDYLLGRDVPPSVSGWHKWPEEQPTEDGDYVLVYRTGDGIRTNIVLAEWLEGDWSLGLGMSPEDMNWTVLRWIEWPEDC